MLIQYLGSFQVYLSSLDEKFFNKLYNLFDYIKGELLTEAPRTTVTVPISEGNMRKRFLEVIGRQEKVWTLKKIKGQPDLLSLKVDRDKFDSLYKILKEEESERASLKGSSIHKKHPQFDPLTGTVSYQHRHYVVRSKIRKKLLKKLWIGHREIDNGKQGRKGRKGKIFPKSFFAVQSGIIESPSQFQKKEKEQLKGEVSELNRAFKRHNFPMHITVKGGVQLIITIEAS